MQQLYLFPKTENTPASCVFTGHRSLGEDFSAERLEDAILQMINEGITTFFCGMAIGFDLLAAEIVLSIKEKNPQIKLIACIPCEAQDKYYSKADQMRYHTLLLTVDERVVLSENYYRGCMQVRDDYMAKRADCMIAYCKKTEGGTAYTVRRFQKHHPDGKILFI